MQLLTPSGYKNIEDCQIGEQLIAYDIFTGQVIINELLNKSWFSYDMFEDSYSLPEEYIDENGDTVTKPPVLLKTKKENFESVHGELKGYVINNKWTLYRYQSVWANMNITHAQNLQIGDIIYDNNDNDIEITSIQEVDLDGWWRLKVSGDHSYIADDLTLHNATRYWVGGGSSANWNATGNTNWGSSSGGANNASVPTNADDVIFDGAGTNGNTNSTISATITILSLNITTGYTATMTHNAVLTIAGNFTFTGNYARAGSSGVTISATSTITSNGVTWNLPLTFNNVITITLNGNLTVSGLVTCTNGVGTYTFNRTSSENFIMLGGMVLNNNNETTGNVKFIWKGGTFESGTIFGAIGNNTDIDGNITFGTYCFHNCTLTYVSGIVNTGTGTLIQSGTAIFNTNGISWWNLKLSGTLPSYQTGVGSITSNMVVLNTLSGGGGGLNATTNETITVFNGINCDGTNGIRGTAEVILKGGTVITAAGIYRNFAMPLTLDGNITFNNNLFAYGNDFVSGQTIKYLSGTNNISSTTFEIHNWCTLDLGAVTWANISLTSTALKTVTLLSDLNTSGLLTITTGNATINTSVGARINVRGGLLINRQVSGTADIYLFGGTWTTTNISNFFNNLFLNGNITISGTVRVSGGTKTYLSGVISSDTASLEINGSSTFIGFDKVPLRAVTITAGQTVTMDRFFNGLDGNICQITSTGANYTIQFNDGFEKIAKNVAISGATFTRPNQLLVITNPLFNTNRGTNIGGVRYKNDIPNGFSKGLQNGRNLITPSKMLVSDPNFLRQG